MKRVVKLAGTGRARDAGSMQNPIQVPLITEARPSLQHVEVATTRQIPGFFLVGLPAPEVAEARERVRAAIGASGFEFPQKRVLVNLSPAAVRKRGTGIDLGIALAVLASQTPETIASTICWGELGLDGQVRPVGRVARALVSAWQAGAARIFLATADAEIAFDLLPRLPRGEILRGPPPQIVAVDSLKQAWEFLRRREVVVPKIPTRLPAPAYLPPQLLRLPLGLERVICLSAVGAHHLLLLGPKGSGKSHALEWLRWLTPTPAPEHQLERLLIGELRGAGSGDALSDLTRAPYRRVGTQARPPALCGSYAGGVLNPGEVSLAHGGILAIDEMPELARDSREALRGPLEEGRVSLHSPQGNIELPARFQLAASGNLCPCGNWAPARSTGSPCICGVTARVNYLSRIDTPVIDRIDLTCVLNGPPTTFMINPDHARILRNQVQAARNRLIKEWGVPSAQIDPHRIEAWAQENELAASNLLDTVASLRARHKAFRVAITIAAWENRSEVDENDLCEAQSYRFAREIR